MRVKETKDGILVQGNSHVRDYRMRPALGGYRVHWVNAGSCGEGDDGPVMFTGSYSDCLAYIKAEDRKGVESGERMRASSVTEGTWENWGWVNVEDGGSEDV